MNSDQERRRKARLRRDAHDKKMRRSRNKQRLEWSRKTFEGQQIRKMGFTDRSEYSESNWYKEYLKTDHWKKIKKQYKDSDLPQYCLVCENPKYELHHRSYDRIGAELLTDLISLCRKHHSATHKLVKKGANLWDAHLKLIDA